MDYVVFWGLIVGVAFGVVLQRGRLCFNSAIRDVKFFGDNFIFKAAVLAIALNTIAFTFLSQIGVIKLVPMPFMPVANIIGGLIFGIGMVLAGGCASGVTYRVGEGMMTALVAAFTYGITASAAKASFLKPLLDLLKGPSYTVHGDGVYYASQNVGPTVASTFNLNPWIPALIFASIAFFYLAKSKTSKRPDSPWNWVTIGILASIISAFAYSIRQVVEYGPAYGLGITGGWVALMKYLTNGSYLGWSGALIVGIIAGALVISVIKKEFKIRAPRKPMTFVKVICGGALMGFGAALAGGCNIGHILTGVPHLAWSSLLAMTFIIIGNWLGYYIFFERKN